MSYSTTKRCTKCGIEKPHTIEFFHKNKNCPNGLHYSCKDCQRQRSKNYGKKHREERDARVKQWNIDHPDRTREIKQNWKRKNREKVLAQNREYKHNNPEKSSLDYHRRAARKRGLPSDFTFKQWQRCLEYFHNCCAYCGHQEGFWNYLTADHFIPLSNPACPGTVATNMIPACNECNASKNNREVKWWLNTKYSPTLVKRKLKNIEQYFDSLK